MPGQAYQLWAIDGSEKGDFHIWFMFSLYPCYCPSVSSTKSRIPTRVQIAVFGPAEEIENLEHSRNFRSGFSTFRNFYNYLAQGHGRRAGVFISNNLALASEEVEELARLHDTPAVLVSSGRPREYARLAWLVYQPNFYFLPSRTSTEQIRTVVSLIFARLRSKGGREVSSRLWHPRGERASQPYKSSLDSHRLLSEVAETSFLFDEKNGRLDARKIAELFGLSLRELSNLIGIRYETVHKTSSSPQVHKALLDYERVARALSLLNNDRDTFRKWLNRKNRDLDQRTPLEAIKQGYVTSVADLIESALLGEPR